MVPGMSSFYQRFSCLSVAVLLAAVCAAGVAADEKVEELGALGVEAGRNALEPPDTSSPRATLRSFVDNAREAWRIFLSTDDPDRAVYERARRRLQRAARCLDLSGVPPAARDEAAGRTAVLLLDVFERISLPRWSAIPDAAKVEADQLTEWVVPHTPIELGRVDEGPRAGEFLFTQSTVARAHEFHDLTLHLKPGPNAVIADGFEVFRTLPGWVIPLSWVRGLPHWARVETMGQAIWQWLLLVAAVLLAVLIVGLVRGWARRPSAGRGAPSYFRRMAVPSSFLVLAWLLGGPVIRQIGLKGSSMILSDLVLSGVLVLALAWLAIRGGGAIAEYVVRLPSITERSVDAHLVRLSARVLSMLAGVLIVVEGCRSLGVPIAGLVAGVGVGGLAVALAAQSTIENFIGSLTIFADRPVRVGDFCRFGEEVGTVEEIGLRSTRLRTLGRSLMTIPNSEFSRLRLDNYSQRDANLFRAVLSLRYETTPRQLRDVLRRIRELLLENPLVRDAPTRVRLVELGEYAFEIEVFAVVEVKDWSEFLAVREEMLLQAVDAVEAAGARLAVPARTSYLARDPLDAAAPEQSG